MKPAFTVTLGERVKLGQTLFTDRKMTDIKFTSPGGGRVIEINRGEKRRFESVVIVLDKVEKEVTFDSYSAEELDELGHFQIVQLLLDSGLWTTLRTRPYSKVPDPDSRPHSIFVTAMDTNPHAPKVHKAIEGNEDDFKNGIKVLAKLTEGMLYICKEYGSRLPEVKSSSVSVKEFSGVHPAGLVGTHIHFVDPVGPAKTVWHISIDDVVSVGKLFTTGRLALERVISLAGPGVKNPRLIKTRVGASIEDITTGELSGLDLRIISGSILSGREAYGVTNYLGRFHRQLSVLAEGRERVMLGWARPGFDMYSVKSVFVSKLTFWKKFNFNTALNGAKRAIIPAGSYEQVMPLDILATFLLRSLHIEDIEEAEKLGALELDEEDLALCTFVCPSKLDYGPMLRTCLERIEKEG
jgi:Na+-transporting NADH:ubiquinone oxidoreductase subunit A